MAGRSFNEEVSVEYCSECQPDQQATRSSQFSRRMLLGAGAAVAAASTLGLGDPAFADGSGPVQLGGEGPFGPVVVTSSKGSYARVVRLSTPESAKSQSWLATFQGGPGPGFPLYRSDDDGRTWQKQSSATNVGESTGFSLQPFLYELPHAFAGLPKGSLLFSCNWLGASFDSTNIQLYASTDGGLTWQFKSTVAQGGRANTTNGATPVWEPFLLLHNGKLICYCSDQRDPNFGQKLAHQTSTDLHTWGPVVDDATGTTYAQRPGMTTMAQLKDRLWIMTYEYGVPDNPDNPDQDNYSYHVHYRMAKDPESFGFAADTPLVDQDGNAPNGAPVVSWSDSGGKHGTIIVTDNDDQDSSSIATRATPSDGHGCPRRCRPGTAGRPSR